MRRLRPLAVVRLVDDQRHDIVGADADERVRRDRAAAGRAELRVERPPRRRPRESRCRSAARRRRPRSP